MSQKIIHHKSWVSLNQKYKIALIAPSSKPLQIEKLKKIINHNIFCPNDLVNKEGGHFHSNSEKYRYEHLLSLINSDEENLIIWCISGGYGAAKIISYLEKIPKPKTEKIFIGYSDITALHLFFSKAWGWKTIHGPVFREFISDKKNPRNILNTLKVILERGYKNTISYLKPLNDKPYIRKKILANITGGNLVLCSNSIGTSWEIDTNDKILFLEDVGEKGYQIDRMLLHLSQAGKFHNVKAIIFGTFSESDRYKNYALKEFANQHSYIPCFQTNKFGHGYYNYPLIYNLNSEIKYNNENQKFSFCQFPFN